MPLAHTFAVETVPDDRVSRLAAARRYRESGALVLGTYRGEHSRSLPHFAAFTSLVEDVIEAGLSGPLPCDDADDGDAARPIWIRNAVQDAFPGLQELPPRAGLAALTDMGQSDLLGLAARVLGTTGMGDAMLAAMLRYLKFAGKSDVLPTIGYLRAVMMRRPYPENPVSLAGSAATRMQELLGRGYPESWAARAVGIEWGLTLPPGSMDQGLNDRGQPLTDRTYRKLR